MTNTSLRSRLLSAIAVSDAVTTAAAESGSETDPSKPPSSREDHWAAPTSHVLGEEMSPFAPAMDRRTRAALAQAWLDDALHEHASVAAFARFAMLLLGVSAPPELVADAQRASLDEIAHARDCFALARAYGATEAGPGPLDVDDALAIARAKPTVADLAALTAEEGCIGETVHAVIAQAQLDGADHADVRRALTRIARDEIRHAELAWRFVAWAIAAEKRGRADARGVTRRVTEAVERSVAATRALPVRSLAVDPAAWRAHGRLECREARAIAERAIADTVLPCLRAATGRSTPPLREAARAPQSFLQ